MSKCRFSLSCTGFQLYITTENIVNTFDSLILLFGFLVLNCKIFNCYQFIIMVRIIVTRIIDVRIALAIDII